jgi:16S rRNA (uracil1498-N3)-methyltransferase
MRLTRIFADTTLTTGATLLLPSAAAQHLVRVLRLPAGAALRMFNGRGGEFDASIESIARSTVTVRIGAHLAVERESPLQVTLLQGIARGEKMDFILQKTTELGVTAVVPVTTARSTVRLDADTTQRKHGHWLGVLISASEQCGRNRIPNLATAMGLLPAIAGCDAPVKLLLEPDADATTLKALLTATSTVSGPNPGVCLLVGPEGGLDPQEVHVAREAGFVSCQLGPRVLRTETAALAALAALQALAGDLT